MHEKIFTQWGCLSFFVQSKTGEVSYWKRNVGSGVGTKTFWSGISGYEFLRVRSFCDFTNNYGFIEQHCHFVFFLLLLIKVLSIQEVFCKGTIPLQSFLWRSCETWLFSTIPWCPHSFPTHENLRYSNFLWHRTVPLQFFFSAVRQKTFQRRKVISPSYAWKCPIPQVF